MVGLSHNRSNYECPNAFQKVTSFCFLLNRRTYFTIQISSDSQPEISSLNQSPLASTNSDKSASWYNWWAFAEVGAGDSVLLGFGESVARDGPFDSFRDKLFTNFGASNSNFGRSIDPNSPFILSMASNNSWISGSSFLHQQWSWFLIFSSLFFFFFIMLFY